MRRAWWGALCLGLIAACQPVDALPTQAPADSVWGNAVTLATVGSSDAPAIGTDGAAVVFGWSQSAQGATRHMVAPLHGTPAILSLDAWNPLDYTLLPVPDDGMIWLWRDRTAQDPNGFRLQTTRVDADLVAQLQPILLSPNRVLHYSAAPDGDGVRVVWSEGAAGAPTLWTTSIDRYGRAPFAEATGREGDYPSLVTDSGGTLWLYWLNHRQVWRARWSQEQWQDDEMLFAAPEIAVTERLDHFVAAADRARTYLFWQVVDAAGTPRTLMSSGAARGTWAPVRALTVQTAAGVFTTGYNTSASAARAGGKPVGWSMPLALPSDILPVVVTLEDKLVVLFLQNGEPVGMQPLLRVGILFTPPHIASDAARHLMVSWSEPFDPQTARLRLLTTRP